MVGGRGHEEPSKGIVFAARRHELAMDHGPDDNPQRTTPLSCGNIPGSNVKDAPTRTAGDRYTTDA